MRKALYKACAIAAFSLALFAPTAVGAKSSQGVLSNTLDNLEKVAAANPWMSPDIQLQIDKARRTMRDSGSAEREEVPSELYNRLLLLETSTKQLAVLYDPAIQERSALAKRRESSVPELAFQGYVDGALDDPDYPTIDWSFGWDEVLMPSEDDGANNSNSGGDLCQAPGYSVSTRFAVLSTAVALEATKDIASRFCSQSGLGFNASLACIVTDVAANVAKGINTFQETCNAYMTAAEVTATWNGLKTVHGNVQHVYDNVVTHDAEVQALLRQVLRRQNHMMGDMDTVIQLLNTPSGLRPTWPTK